MIPQTEVIRQADTADNQQSKQPLEKWQSLLADVIRDPKELFELLELDQSQLPAAISACQDFPLRVPRAFANCMNKGDWQDPLLLQVLPLGQELDYQPGFSSDPLAEAAVNPAPGLIHKYQGRVLLIVSGGCAINCRYCFRRHFPYQDNNPSRQQWRQTLDYIRQDKSIHEVILSGGDPLAASDKHLGDLVNQIADIPHITTLRIHSRMPVVLPERITDDCIRWLKQSRLQTVMVLHCNHANEISPSVEKALAQLKATGITVLNQAVLLKGVNDDAGTLAQLSQKLFHCGVLPYYLHLLDPVQGAAHFQVSESQARGLIQTLLSSLPGYLIPRLVKEVAGADSKVPIDCSPSNA